MKRRLGMWDQLMERMDLPGEPSPKVPVIEVYGDHRILIENHKGICEYGLEKIRIRTCFGELIICGQCLKLTRMCHQQLIVSGNIEQLTLQKRRTV